jgi:hypothetical protein
MNKLVLFIIFGSILVLSILSTGCPKAVDERIRESSNITALDEATHARDLAIKAAVEININSDPVLMWYARTYGGLTVDVSHAVATVTMKVKTQALHDQALDLARQAKDLRDVVDNITIDPNLEDAPFEW